MKKYQFTVMYIDEKKEKKIIDIWNKKVQLKQIRSFICQRLVSRCSDLFDLRVTVYENDRDQRWFGVE